MPGRAGRVGRGSYVIPDEKKAEELFHKFEKGPESEESTKSGDPGGSSQAG